ncbi:hypothetical protein GCM10017600_27140 [Streptosporangium carneum]|uniref:Uncharacterized protein n=1 Tax=Streptosporangium carneum TaxID=47481 RepID=A0A9W6I167_9ACTN|nr:hypothetical protein GCM10017600_27140 [Streptosporangium carneum]
MCIEEAQGADLGGPRRLVPSPLFDYSLTMINYCQFWRVVVVLLALGALALPVTVFAGPAVALASAGSAHAAPTEPPPGHLQVGDGNIHAHFDAVIDLGGEAAPSMSLGPG